MRPLKITQSITNREGDVLDRYFNDIKNEALITLEEEVMLVKRIKEGDKGALEKLTKANLRFVVSVAKQYQNRGLSLPDLINTGNIGLIKAAQRFNETRGFKFISYAVWWIRANILESLVEDTGAVTKKKLDADVKTKVERIVRMFEQEHERGPSVDEITDVLIGMMDGTRDNIRRHVQRALTPRQNVQFDAPFLGDDEAGSLYEVTEQKMFDPPDERRFQEGEQTKLWEFALKILEKAKEDYTGRTLPDLSVREYLEIFMRRNAKESKRVLKEDFDITDSEIDKIVRFTRITLQKSENFKKEARAHGGRF